MKKVKRSLLPIILAASVATAANADGPCPFEGFYLGLGIGNSVNSGTINHDRTVSFFAPGATTLYSSYTRNVRTGIGGKSNVVGQIYAGYGCPVWDPVYLGVEISGKFGKNSGRGFGHDDSILLRDPITGAFISRIDDASVIRSRHRNWQLGIDFRPGILLCPESLFYVRIGAAWNRVNFNHGTRYAFVGPAGTATFVGVNSDRRRHNKKASLRLGVGLEQQFCECWSIRADYVYTDYRKHRHNDFSTRFTVPFILGTVVGGDTGVYTQSSRAKVQNHTAMLGFSYYFN